MLPPIASLSLFRDLPLKVQLPPDLERQVKALAERPQATLSPTDWPAYIDEAVALTTRCVDHCESEMSRLTEQRFSMPDPNALKQRLIGDPRRQVDQLLQGLKQKLANEKQEWARRVAKQMSDVATTLDQQIDSLVMSRHDEEEGLAFTPDAKWLRDFEGWKVAVFDKWASHLAPLLQSKTTQLIQPEIDGIREILDEPLVVALPTPSPMPLPMGRDQAKEYVEKVPTPTAFEAFFELFKGNLATVSMIAGMVIIPVVSDLMSAAAAHIKAMIMGVIVAPILGFAALQAKGMRRKIITTGEEKARQNLRKAIATEAKAELDRFKPDAERYSAAYCNTAQSAALAVIEPTIARSVDRREQRAAADLAKAHMSGERLQELTGTLRQVKTQLTGQLLVDLKRRQLELVSGAQGTQAMAAKA